MRRNMNWSYVEKKDMEFWKSVHQLTFILLRWIGIPGFMKSIWQRPTDGDRRIISYPEQYLQVVTPLCEFFSFSPDSFIPCGDYVCNIRETLTPIAFGERELLVKLWQLSEGIANYAYITSLYSQLDPIFLEADDIDWNESVTLSSPQVAQAKTQLENVYRLWVQYIKRHYDHALLGRNDTARLNTRIQCIEALRNHIKPDLMNRTPVKNICDALTIVDDTLCFDGTPDPPIPDFPGGVMGKELLSWLMRVGKVPEKFRPEVIKILRLYQKILVHERKASGNSWKNICFSYWSNNTEYSILFRDNRYTCVKSSKKYQTFAKKHIQIQMDGSATVPKEYLYQMLHGNQEGLCELAKLSAYCLCEEKLFKGAIVLSKEQWGSLSVFLFAVTGTERSVLQRAENMRTISKQNMMNRLIEMKIRGQSILFCNDDGKSLNAEQWARLRKLFSGAHITCKDSILGRKMHKSTAQWFVIGDDETVQKLQKHQMKAKRFAVKIELIPPECSALLWMRQILPLWGYLQMQKKKKGDDAPTYTTVQQFMDQCCQITEEKAEFIEAKTLYDRYKAFCCEQGRSDALKFKDFNDTLESTFGLKRVRHHFTDGRNPTGFDRIVLSALPCGQRTVPEKRDEPLSSKDAFFLKLEEMEQEVRAHFIQYPFD